MRSFGSFFTSCSACGCIGLKTINIPLGALVGLLAVLGVGIGFGLQNLAANFVSGIILLFERPVKVGDRIEVGDVWGDVRQINLRTTVVTTPDDVSIIIPNSKLLDNNVVNFELLCWIPDAALKYDVTDRLNRSIDAAFREAGIEIPFPQRDVHLLQARGCRDR